MWRPPLPSDKSLGYCQMSLRDKTLAIRRWQQDVGVDPNRNGPHPVASRGVSKPDSPLKESRTVAADRAGETENAISATAPLPIATSHPATHQQNRKRDFGDCPDTLSTGCQA